MLNQPVDEVRWAAPPPPTAGAALGQPAILFAKLEPGALG
jgi:hypothetical protein